MCIQHIIGIVMIISLFIGLFIIGYRQDKQAAIKTALTVIGLTVFVFSALYLLTYKC